MVPLHPYHIIQEHFIILVQEFLIQEAEYLKEKQEQIYVIFLFPTKEPSSFTLLHEVL